MPASHADAIRSPVVQRPRKTAFGPCFSKNGSPYSITRSRWSWNGPGRRNSLRPPWRPIAKPTLSPRIAAAAAMATSGTIESWPSCASSAAAISAVSPGTGMPIVSTAISAKTAA